MGWDASRGMEVKRHIEGRTRPTRAEQMARAEQMGRAAHAYEGRARPTRAAQMGRAGHSRVAGSTHLVEDSVATVPCEEVGI